MPPASQNHERGEAGLVWCPERNVPAPKPLFGRSRVISSQPHTAGVPFFLAWFPEKRILMCSRFAGLFPRRTCRFVSQPHPQLTRASILTTDSLQVLHKYLFFSNPRGNRALPCQYQDPFHPREARQTDPCPIQESKSNITTEIPHKGVELLQDETQDSSGSSSGNPKGSGLGITCPRISSCLSLHLLHCPLRAQA